MSPMERTGTAGEVKAKFDQAALAIQKYLNETVVPAVNAAGEGGPDGQWTDAGAGWKCCD